MTTRIGVHGWRAGCAALVMAVAFGYGGLGDDSGTLSLDLSVAHAEEGGTHSDGARRGPRDGRGRGAEGKGAHGGSHSGGHTGSRLEESVLRGGGHHDDETHADDSAHEDHDEPDGGA